MGEATSLMSELMYGFNDAQLLTIALTHRSYSKLNNERLEFIGDSILNFTIAAELYKQFPNVPEGDLSRLRSSLVDKDTLAKVATSLGLGEYIKLGGGELKTGGWRRDSILADATEAIFGAVYEDSGILEAQALVLRLYQPFLKNIPSVEELKDGKTRLQEWLQGRKFPLPQYSVVSVSGKSHDQVFTIRCEVASHEISVDAQGKSRRKAEQEAAKLAMIKILDKQEK